MRLLMLVVVTIVAAVILAVQNASAVSIEVFFWQLEVSLAVLIAFSFAGGAAVSWLISLVRLRRIRSRERALMAQLADAEAAAGSAAKQSDATPTPATVRSENYARG